MSSHQIFKRTRIAPTPSGFLHAGNILSFSLTAAFAREREASILLRIDDLDRARIERAYVQDIFDTLRFLEIPWDEGPRDYEDYELRYSQVHRLDQYRAALEGLAATGRVFACSCSRTDIARESPGGGYPGTCRDKRLPLEMPGVSWRLRTDDAELDQTDEAALNRTDKAALDRTDEAEFYRADEPAFYRADEAEFYRDDEPALNRAPDRALDPSVRDCVIRKKDGMPAYQLTSVVDDLYFDVDLVIRGEDLRPSTEVQRYLARQLSCNDLGSDVAGADAARVNATGAHAFVARAFESITFIHHPLLTDMNGHKLSKSAGALSIQALRRAGYHAEDVYRLISDLLGAKDRAKDYMELAAAAKVLHLTGKS